MRGIRTAGLGLAAVLTGHAAFAQDGRPAATLGAIRPAATLGAIRPAVDPAVVPAGLIARGQTVPQPMPPGSTPVNLSMPRTAGSTPPMNGQPVVVGVGQPIMLGQPTPVGQPFAGGQPFNIGQPLPTGQTFPIQTQAPAAAGSAPVAAAPAPTVVGQPLAAAGPVTAPSVFPGDGLLGFGPAPDAPLFNGGYATALLSGPSNRFFFSADYLLWWIKNPTTPTLLTTSPPGSRGIIGQPGTTEVLGGPSFTETLYGGGRFGGTYWFGPLQQWGLSGDFFFLARNGAQQVFTSAQYPVLARPFYNLNLNQNDSELVGFPGLLNGAAAVNSETSLVGGGFDFRRKLLGICGGCNNLDLLVGFRALRLNESLTISEAVAAAPGVTLPNNALFATVSDEFKTINEFYGVNVGMAGEMRRGRWFLGGKAAIAIGDVFQTIEINGGQTLTTPTGVQAFPGGLYALPGANIGTWTQNRFAVLPEVGLQVGYYLTPHWRLAVGYNLLYLNNVVRPGDQIDTGLDVTRIPNFNLGGPAVTPLPYPRPAPTFKQSDLFIQGISFSVQFVW